MPEIIKAPDFVDANAGPQCDKCTHYEAEHNGPDGRHCMHVLYTLDEPKVTYPPRKLCPCKLFIPAALTLENVLLQVDKLGIGDAKTLRIKSSVKRSFARGIEAKIDLNKLAKMSRKQIVYSGYDTDV